MNEKKEQRCPKCGAVLQENAGFCLYCMTQLTPKAKIDKPPKATSNKRKAAKIAICISLALIIMTASITGGVIFKRQSPICTFARFETAAAVVSEQMGIEQLWDLNGFTDTNYFQDEDVMQYVTDVELGNAYLSVFFYNEGEEIYAYICDVEERYLSGAQDILKCIVQSTANYYYTDIDEIFENEQRYPRSELDTSFAVYFTDLLGRTEQYNESLQNGGDISTKYIVITDDELKLKYIYYLTTRNEGTDTQTTLYDLAVSVQKD